MKRNGAVVAAVLLSAGVALLARPVPDPPALHLDRAALAARVREELAHSWRSYERYARGHDELKPVSRTAHGSHARPLLMTPVDSLYTLILAGLEAEALRAREQIAESLSFDADIEVQN